MFWAMIEMGIAVVAGCLPTIWPLISRISLESLIRSVRRALSLPGSRLSKGKSSFQNPSQPSDRPNRVSEDADSYKKLTTKASKYGPEGFIGVERNVEVKRSFAEDESTQQPDRVYETGIRTVTRIYSTHHGGGNV